jgi:predicted phage tail protein
MTKVSVHGRLGELVGKTHQFACSKLSEVFSALEANTGKLRSYISRNKKRKFSVFVDGVGVKDKNFNLVDVKGKEVVILPILMGAVGFTIMLAVTSTTMATIKTGAIIAAMVINIAFAIGMSLLMSKLLAPDDPDTAATSSYVFGQAENNTRQGVPVPVGYGRFRVGSTVVSASLISVDRAIASNQTFYDSLFELSSNSDIQEDQIDLTSSSIARSI